VAVVFGTRGSSGANEAGGEKAAALGAIREIEARNALTTLGITTCGFSAARIRLANVLQSLANWGSWRVAGTTGATGRLTRPEVILTFLPGTFIGEDHGDHQASGLLATEAFDLQATRCVSGAGRRADEALGALSGEFAAVAAKKIYYFPDADREIFSKGKARTTP